MWPVLNIGYWTKDMMESKSKQNVRQKYYGYQVKNWFKTNQTSFEAVI